MTGLFEELSRMPGQTLTRAALERVVIHVAAEPDLWELQIDRRSNQRMYASLHRDARVDVWAILWRAGSDTGWHDHDTSSGAVRVVEGALAEFKLRLGAGERRHEYRADDCFSFDPSHIHRLVCETGCAVSIHAYSAPLWRLGRYTVDDGGALHRTSVTYADELRPLELTAA
ncbi:MAG: cysteine dioxygenase family protein [Actinomycetota bacterium]|nr:cysteine dioxygenase family protein [Actinomycetota bacterium]